MSLRAFRLNRSSGTYRQNTQDLHGLTDRNGQADRLPAGKYSPICGAGLRKKRKEEFVMTPVIVILRQKFLGELRWFTDMIDTLRVEDTLYKKEANV